MNTLADLAWRGLRQRRNSGTVAPQSADRQAGGFLVENEALASLRTLRDFIRLGMTQFSRAELWYGHGTDNALDEASALVLHVLALPHDLPGHFMDAALTSSEKVEILELFRRRTQDRIPAAYLTREAWFAGAKFYVDPRVLIPRSPIAELIEARFEPWVNPDRVLHVLDLCTGSACIAIAAAHVFPDASVDAVDISSDALAVAAINVENHELTERVRLVESDLFAGLEGCVYDLIVSNPPYVDAQELAAMPAEYHHEPALGLAAGADGLDAVDIILQHAAAHLSEDGVLIVEVGASEETVVAKYPEIPFTWLEFARGGSGVFMLTREQLIAFTHA